MRKRLLSALLAMAMMLTMLPMSAFAAPGDPVVVAGFSVNGSAVATDVPAHVPGITTASVDAADNDKNNIVWFAMTGLTAETEYTISMKKGNDELLTDNAVEYGNGGLTFTTAADQTKKLLYVSLDEFNADGSGQGDATKLGDGGVLTVTLTGGSKTATTKIHLVKDNGTWKQIPVIVRLATAADTADGKIFEQAIADLVKGEITITPSADGKTFTVVGETNWVNWPKFNEADASETKGNYLPLFINFSLDTTKTAQDPDKFTLTASKAKEHTIDPADGATLVAVRLDAITENGGKKVITLAYKGVDYTIDVTDVQLATEPAAEKTVDIRVATNADYSEKYLGKNLSELVNTAGTVANNGNAYTLTGAETNWLTWAKFNETDATETKGNYLPLYIYFKSAKDVAENKTFTITGSKTKTVELDKADGAAIVCMRMDAITANGEGKKVITVVYDSVTYTIDVTNVKLATEPTAQKTKITEVNITLPVADVALNGTMPTATVTTTPADGAEVALGWRKADGTEIAAADAVKTAGTYTARLVVTAKAGYELADNVVYKLNGATVQPPITTRVKVVAPTPKMVAGLSMNAEEAVKDIKAATGLTADLADEDAENLLWFVMTGLEAGEYTMSMKGEGQNAAEVLNGNSVAYGQGNRVVTIGESGKYLLYVSLDEFSADGLTGQGNKTALGNGGKFTVTATKGEGQDAVVVSGEINLVTVELKAADATTSYTSAVLFAQQNGKVKIPASLVDPVRTGYTFQGWSDGDKTYAKGETVTVAAANVTLNALWSNNAVEATDAVVDADAITDSTVKDSLNVSAPATNLLKDKGVTDETERIVTTQLDTDAKKDAILPDGKKVADGYTVIVEVYLEVVANKYTAPADDEPAVLKLDVTPKYRYAAKKGTDPAEEIPGQTGTALGSREYAEPVTVTVTLAKDKGFAAGDANVYALHYGDDNKVDQYISATVTANGADKVDIAFEASKFSPYAITKDARTVDVVYKQEGEADISRTYTPANIGDELPTVTVADDKEFKGWAVDGDANKTIVVAPTAKTLTEEILNVMIEKATGTPKALTLYAVIGDKNNNVIPGGPGGGGSGATTYSVNVPTTEHGTVTVNPRNKIEKDATVTITVAPDKGYHLESLTVTDKGGNNIELTKVDSNKYTFKMPASSVEVKATFVEGEAPAVSFTDVTEGEYYYDAVLWAVDKGITTGLTETTFGPNASCTRAQMVTFLWRAAGSPEPTATTTAFTDIDANEYYYKAVLWAVEKGITTGATETTFAPNATVTRAQTVTFLYRYAGKPAVSGSNGFTDLEAGEYYVDAVQWAATNGITTGTTETTFSPANNCTRGQIVTFLYRHIVK